MTMNSADSHPYDTPWQIVKDLRAQVHDLRSAFQAEQQQRAAEVTELRNEVAVLKDGLAKERHERQVQCHNLTNDITTIDASFQKSIDEIKSVQRQQLHQLHQIIQDEIRDRKATESHRDTREASLKSELQTTKNTFDSDMGQHRNDHARVKDDHATRINYLMHDLGLVVDYLQKVSGSWDMLKGATLRSANKAVHNSGSPNKTASPYGYPQFE